MENILLGVIAIELCAIIVFLANPADKATEKETIITKGKTQFIEPVSAQEQINKIFNNE